MNFNIKQSETKLNFTLSKFMYGCRLSYNVLPSRCAMRLVGCPARISSVFGRPSAHHLIFSCAHQLLRIVQYVFK